MVKTILYELSLQSPLYVSSNKFANFLEMKDYIPASAIRGALASSMCSIDDKWQCQSCSKRTVCNFEKVIPCKSMVYFTHCYPKSTPLARLTETSTLPATAMSCKQEPGFFTEYDYKREKTSSKGAIVPYSSNSNIFGKNCFLTASDFFIKFNK